MKLLDPLAIMQYFGGSILVHAILAVYAGHVIFDVENKIVCPD